MTLVGATALGDGVRAMNSASINDAMKVLDERGFVNQCTDEARLKEAFKAGPVTTYVGYDCTAPSLHAGSLVSIMMLRWLQKLGHRPIVLMGGGTSKVGDPSGKTESRKLLDDQTINANLASIKTIFQKYLRFDEASGARMVNNAEWLDGLNHIEFLRTIGQHFSVKRMMTFDSVKLKLDDPDKTLSYLEFGYMILQAYDFLELSRRYGCTLQMGGGDQWGNIVNGIELGRRVDDRELFGLTCPLLTTASGAKMGKTAEGAVWLNAEALSPYGYWQYWRNTEDLDVGKFLRLFTELPLEEVARLEALKGAERNEAKKVLATEATALCHGREAALQAAETAKQAFSQGASAAGLPEVLIPQAELDAGIAIFALLFRAGLVESNSEGRKLVRNNGAKVNDVTVSDEKQLIGSKDFGPEGAFKLSAGKKRHVLVKAG